MNPELLTSCSKFARATPSGNVLCAARPFILLVVDQDTDKILKTEIMRERPAPQTVLEQLFKTMQGTL
jgi:hypothetical protein